MSPEQARGEAVDKRTDIWAFGCVLFEMLTGAPAFHGNSVTEVLARVLERQPDLQALPPRAPTAIRHVLTRTLEKDPKWRLRDIGEARVELSRPTASGGWQPSERERWNAGFFRRRCQPSPCWRRRSRPGHGFTLVPSRIFRRRQLASRSRHQLILQFRWTTFLMEREGSPFLPMAHMWFTQPEPPTRGNCGNAASTAWNRSRFQAVRGGQPFLSPDSRWVGFIVGNEIRKVPTDGGAVVTIGRHQSPVLGAAWAPDDTIYFGSQQGVLSIPAGGGVPKVVAAADAAAREIGDQDLALVPGRDVVLTEGYSRPDRIEAVDVHTGVRKLLLDAGHPLLPDSEHLLYTDNAGNLNAVRFDAARLEVVGDPVSVLPQTNPTGPGDFAVSRNGTFVYVSVVQKAGLRTLVWFDRAGREQPTGAPFRNYVVLRLSPDGAKAAVSITEQRDRKRHLGVGLHATHVGEADVQRHQLQSGLDPRWSADHLRF